jgi:hypothetical protein
MKSTLDTEQAGSNDLDAVLAEAREREGRREPEGERRLVIGWSFDGVAKAAMPLNPSAFLGEAVRAKH